MELFTEVVVDIYGFLHYSLWGRHVVMVLRVLDGMGDAHIVVLMGSAPVKVDW